MAVVGSAAGDKPKIIVRDGLQADVPEVAALKVRSWDDAYRPLVGSAVVDQLLDVDEHHSAIQRDLGKRNAFMLVAEAQEGEIVGFALSHLDEGGEPFLESLHVRPGLRGTGIGAALLRATARRWSSRGFGSMSLHVVAANVGARRFYERLGAAAVRTVADDWRGTSVLLVVYRWPSLVRMQEH
jgi:ribosomal protein S18 acetylase RimI-like enzyme